LKQVVFRLSEDVMRALDHKRIDAGLSRSDYLELTLRMVLEIDRPSDDEPSYGITYPPARWNDNDIPRHRDPAYIPPPAVIPLAVDVDIDDAFLQTERAAKVLQEQAEMFARQEAAVAALDADPEFQKKEGQ
jgi:hypothetical protein